MNILAFETSCDDTSIAIFNDNELVAMNTASQIKTHSLTGGVVPEVASRLHAESIIGVLSQTMLDAGLRFEDIDVIAVTTNPGLIPSLLTGIIVASTISVEKNIPIMEINHIQGHIFSVFLERSIESIKFPALCLTVSGGHNDFYIIKDFDDLNKVGGSQDDAAGEAFDKVAKMMGLDYPGGPIISKLSREYENLYAPETATLFPRPMSDSGDLVMSFSGLKSAVRREIESLPDITLKEKQRISYEFEMAVVDILSKKTDFALKQNPDIRSVFLTGGVSANDRLTSRLKTLVEQKGLAFYGPTKKVYSTDNAAMIGMRAYLLLDKNIIKPKIGVVTI